MARTVLIGGNWKCNGSRESVKELVNTLNDGQSLSDVEVVVAPTFLHIDYVLNNLRKDFKVACQNLTHLNDKAGAFTGEVTATIAKDFGLEWAITGHSERRSLNQESDEDVATKTKYGLEKGLNIILCIGETLAEREAGNTMNVLYRQMQAVVSVLKEEQWANVVIAYEPVWAIGTGVVATPDQAQEVHEKLRIWIGENISKAVADSIRILYGGSVKGSNSRELISLADVDGFLVGGAALTSDFLTIIQNASGSNPAKL